MPSAKLFYGPLHRRSKRAAPERPPLPLPKTDAVRDSAIHDVWYEETLQDYHSQRRHWHIAQMLGKVDFESYWALIMGHPPAKSDLVYEEITPTLSNSGSLIRVTAFYGWDDFNKDLSTLPDFYFSFSLPPEEDLASGEWRKREILTCLYDRRRKYARIYDLEEQDMRLILGIIAKSIVMWTGSCPSRAAYIWRAGSEKSGE
ncbi:MAG: hypothetical protein LQ352_008109 [Teloschistes flavicans]|nr:MAG: hypothetical protein LQ352_008109 [Teloschistes flavicans]